ncbi:MinD/ParA family protein [Neobacillus notoginsengisoli]|uniref:MinD/ParA family protein n=1 Tax=Neobacillus notoginsengisoli TaxID=1578198 RepID=A0A417YJH2_9BACI|nr:MinD/ParA family protein [Neobacillus notoginsengisoli]RHW33296.1 MinD/ParA family protein [Neobacillus notoginsengisoli]
MLNDQAYQLRQLSESLAGRGRPFTRVVTVASGKGGVGKSNFTLNFALSLMELGQKVVVIDLDIGMANLDILMGTAPRHHLFDMVRLRKNIWEVLEKGPRGLEYLAGGSGFQQLCKLEEEERDYFFRELEKLQGYADIVLIDTGAGMTLESQRCHLSADDIILLTTPEPTSMADAYSVVKILHNQKETISFHLLINRVGHYREGMEAAGKFKMAVQSFLNRDIKIFGAIPDDSAVTRSVLKQVPFYTANPRSPASLMMKKLAVRFSDGTAVNHEKGGMKGFISSLTKMLRS